MKIFIAIILVSFMCKLTFAQEQSPTADDNKNWVSSISFNLNGQTINKSVNYFNSLGKGKQQQEWDPIFNKIWISQTEYDNNGRNKLQTFSAPFKLNRFDYNTFFLTDILLEPINDYTAPLYSELALAKYYSEDNEDNPYQDVTEYPYSSVKYSNLNPGQILETYGGNKIENENGEQEWLQAYSFTLPAGSASLLKQKLGNTSLNAGGYTKTVAIDVHGVENVIFKDAEDNVIAAARSGQGSGTSSRFRMVEGMEFVDIHVPEGVSGIGYSGVTYNSINVIIYDLKSEKRIYPSSTSSTIALVPGVYRIQVNLEPELLSNVYFDVQENYYDFSVNTYDEASRLISAKQPLNSLETTYNYNTLGQLQESTSVDEGNAKFKYRSDGQIRFSQNAKQAEAGELSYTNYDTESRPVESGVWKETQTYSFNGTTSSLDNIIDYEVPAYLYYEDRDVFGNENCTEQNFTLYDLADTEGLLSAFGSDSRRFNYQKQQFVAGSVSKTFTQNPNTNTTWYSYDVQGRVTWMVQKIEGLSGLKTIDYEYDFATGQVAKVYFQKGLSSEQFIHKYTYNIKGQLVTAETSVDDTTFTENALYEYAETGELIRTELEGGLQGIDYVYNLNGQLKAINHPSLEASKDRGGDTNDVFGMIIDYHKDDYKRSNVNINSSYHGIDQYNGNIKSVRWNNKAVDTNISTEKTYVYSYNRNNWLTAAEYGENIGSGVADGDHIVITGQDVNNDIRATSSITVSSNNGGVTINPNVTLSIVGFTKNINNDYAVSNITYDANGNIQTLKRNKHTESGNNNDMDNMVYHYDPAKPNQLKRVEDIASNTDNTSSDDIKTQDANNYEYNSIGQLVKNNEEFYEYEYNSSGLVTKVQTNHSSAIEFFYNDRGHRLKKVELGRGFSNTTYYVRDAAGTPVAIYYGTSNAGGNSISLAEHAVYGASRLGVYKRADATTAYELTDHLGNVRAVVQKNKEETGTDYYPFGMPMPLRNSLSDYRYAFQGQEKDSETGKEAFELRLWDARIGRWLRTDPYRQYHSPYLGMGNNPSSAFDSDGGYVYIMGKNGELLRIYNKVIGTEVGAKAIDYFIDNPNSHVIISNAKTKGAGGVTLFLGNFISSTLFSKSEVNSAISNLSGKDKNKYSDFYRSFSGAVLQPGNNFFISVDTNNNSNLFNLEAAFHEIYAHAYARELGIYDNKSNPENQHFAFGGSENGRFDNLPSQKILGPTDIAYPIEEFFYTDTVIKEMGGVFIDFTPDFGRAGSLFFGKNNGGATKVEKTVCPCVNPRNY